MYSDLKYLSTPLPEDMLKLKYFGDFDRLISVIDKKLENPSLPIAMRKRLEYEKLITPLWIQAYPHDQEKALQLLRECFGDFSEAELEQLRDDDAVEWAYINGKVHYKNNFLGNLIKTRPQYETRVLDENRLTYKRENAKLLNSIMERMKNEGKLICRFHMRSTMTIDALPGREGQKVYAHLPLPIEYAQVKNFNIL